MFRRVAAIVLMLALAACAGPHPRRAPVAGNISAGTLQALPLPGEYRIDSVDSEVRLLVYRAGPLARLGHNHVMVNRALHGDVTLERNLPDSTFELIAPVSAFSYK